MQNRPFTYLLWMQYLGFRYNGWQKQPDGKTVQGRMEKVLRFVLGHGNFTTLAASRTDAGVSCNRGAFELFSVEPVDLPELIQQMNVYLPNDIRILEGQAISQDFNIIQDVVLKEYRYHFATGDRFHPFAAANLLHVTGELNIPLMKKGGDLLLGKHDFRRFCSVDKITDDYVREVYGLEILDHEMAGKGLLPKTSFTIVIKGKGFLRYQVRVMVAVLIDLGLKKITMDQISAALVSQEAKPLSEPARAHGLVLEALVFDFEKEK
ncbi:tRNA pseudouridine(38-40) synthase TruA [Rhodonellum sp.]|uniref:tRNA pseudouridine synthase A n=1 Tax=Rhodonellum sp. TaxID=2231180 RepID=UPI00271FCDAF|nr:tRNA pseudouridine(38-40) synthase TruA [Rhodonellum sp.]MDO9550931.1 tRNA pseudouridine(38-40) synthase TruA [Rhodonellum sp.]